MGRKVDLADIIDAGDVAQMIGLTHRASVRTYRKRYPDFPEPVKVLSGGRCLMWLRSDVERWLVSRGRR